MLRRVSAVSVGAVSLLLLSAAAAAVPASASESSAGTAFIWVGAEPNQGDGHSWKDARNWQPEGVPGNGDSVSIDAENGSTCASSIDGLPGNLHLKMFSLVARQGCTASVRGGSITVTGSLSWAGGTVNSPLILGPASRNLVEVGAQTAAPTLGRELDIDGLLEVQGSADAFGVAPGVPIIVSNGGNLQIDPGARLQGLQCCADPSLLEVEQGGTVSVPDDALGFGDATISGFALQLVNGTTDVAPGSVLRITGGAQGLIGNATLQGGGSVLLANPTQSENQTTFLDGSDLTLLPGGTIEGDSLFEGEGFMTWRGGHLSGVDLGFQLEGFTVAGPHTKYIDKVGTFRSNVEILNDVTFAAGTAARPNLLDGQGNAFVSFFSTLTLKANVEIRRTGFGSSQGNTEIDPGAGNIATLDRTSTLGGSGQIDIRSGTFVSYGRFEVGLSDSSVVVEKDAVLRLPDPARPLLLEAGTLTGQGEVDGSVVNEGGVLEPYNAGSDLPLRIHGDYIQHPGGELRLDLSRTSKTLRIGGVADVQGTVTYANQPGYSPRLDGKRRIINTTISLSWTPDCEQTTGTKSDSGHWVSTEFFFRAFAVFTPGASDTC